jgi:hypothetical protein
MREKISERKVYLKAKKINQWDWPSVIFSKIMVVEMFGGVILIAPAVRIMRLVSVCLGRASTIWLNKRHKKSHGRLLVGEMALGERVSYL